MYKMTEEQMRELEERMKNLSEMAYPPDKPEKYEEYKEIWMKAFHTTVNQIEIVQRIDKHERRYETL